MFTEPQIGGLPPSEPRAGWIEVICGCMFSGKTEELIRRLNRAIIAKQTVRIFKPAVDDRYHAHDVVSHNQTRIPSTSVAQASDLPELTTDCRVVGIDEAQFFDEAIVAVCNQLANSGKRVVVAGLDMDYAGRPFGPMPNLMAVAEYVTKVHAICAVSGAPASFSFRLSETEDQLQVGDHAHYEARSRYYFFRDQKGTGNLPPSER